MKKVEFNYSGLENLHKLAWVKYANRNNSVQLTKKICI